MRLFRPDGRTIATAGKSGDVEYWDAVTGKLVNRFAGAEGHIRTFAFSHDGRTLLAGCDGYALRLDAANGNRLGAPLTTPEEYVWEVGFSRDDKRVFTLAGDPYRKRGVMQIWEVESGRALGPPMLDELVLPAATFRPEGRFIATGDWEGKARLWDAESGTPVGPPLSEPAPVPAVAFSPDGRTLAAGAHDGTITLLPIPTPLPGSSEQIQVWLEWATGQQLDDSGVAHELRPDDRALRLRALAKLGGPPLKTQ